MSSIETIDGENWRELANADLSVLVLGKTDCENCAVWSAELEAFLESDTEFNQVRFGKIMLDHRGLADFKKNNAWIADLDVLPYNVIYSNGERKKEYAGGGIDRLTNRLRRLTGSAE